MRTGACTDSRSRVLRMFSALALYQEVALDTGFRTSRLLSFQVPDWRRTRPSSMGELTVAAMASAFARERARKTRRARGRAGHRPGRPSPAVQWVTDVRFPATRGRCRSPHDAGQRDGNSAHGEVMLEVELVSAMWHACPTQSPSQTASVRACFASPSAPSSAAPDICSRWAASSAAAPRWTRTMMRPASLPKDAGRRRARRSRRPHPRPCSLRRPRWPRLRCPRRPRRRPSPRRLCFGRRRRHRRQLRPRPLHSRLAATSPLACNWQHEDRSARVELLEAGLAAKRHAAQEAAVARSALPEQNTNSPIFG